MKNIEIHDGEFTLEQVKSCPNKYFVISDNLLKAGFNPYRNLDNVRIITTKRGSSSKSAAYFSNSDFEEFQKILTGEIVNIKLLMLNDAQVVFSNIGYGNNEKIEIYGNKIKEYLDLILKSNFNFDNLTGKKFVKIPSYSEIQASSVLHLDTLVYNTLTIEQINSAVLSQKKIAFTINIPVDIDTLIKLTSSASKEVIVCRVINSYICKNISPQKWSSLELCDIRKYDETKFQILTEFICSVNPNGVMNFNNDIFGGTSTKSKIEPKKETVKNEVQKSENQQIIDLLTQINSKLDILVSAKSNQK